MLPEAFNQLYEQNKSLVHDNDKLRDVLKKVLTLAERDEKIPDDLIISIKVTLWG